jgi:alkylation response protein AidB-like acyl-CoA dehydrogenase
MEIMGVDGLISDGPGLQGMAFPAAESGTPNTVSSWVDYYFRARAATIYAGATQVQRNIVGERLLGLPK